MRVLIVSYYFPPLGLAGTARPVALANYLAGQGNDVFVISVKPIAYPAYDKTMESQLDPHIQVVRVGSTDPARLQHFLPLLSLKKWLGQSAKSVVSTSMFPDSKIGFVPGAARAVANLIDPNGRTLLITTSPPMSAHLVGLKHSESNSVTWLADFRDIWSSLPFAGDDAEGQRKAESLLQEIISKASLVTATSPKTATSFSHKFDVATKVKFLPNGFSESDFNAPAQIDAGVVGIYGTLNHLVGFERIAQWLGDFAKAQVPASFTLRHIGYLDLPEIDEMLTRVGLSEKFQSTGYLPHPQAVASIRRCAVNVVALSADYDTSYVVPSKLWELLRAEPPLIAILPRGNAARELLEQHNFPGVWIADTGEQFATAMRQALDPSHKYRGLRSDFSSEFEWTNLFSRLSVHLKEVGA